MSTPNQLESITPRSLHEVTGGAAAPIDCGPVKAAVASNLAQTSQRQATLDNYLGRTTNPAAAQRAERFETARAIAEQPAAAACFPPAR